MNEALESCKASQTIFISFSIDPQYYVQLINYSSNLWGWKGPIILHLQNPLSEIFFIIFYCLCFFKCKLSSFGVWRIVFTKQEIPTLSETFQQNNYQIHWKLKLSIFAALVGVSKGVKKLKGEWCALTPDFSLLWAMHLSLVQRWMLQCYLILTKCAVPSESFLVLEFTVLIRRMNGEGIQTQLPAELDSFLSTGDKTSNSQCQQYISIMSSWCTLA